MARLKRIALGLLVAYAASMTLYASRKSAEAWFYRRLYELLTRGDPYHRREGYPLLGLAKDFGMERTTLESWSLWIADVQGPLLMPLIVLFFLLGLGAALISLPSRSNFDKD